MPTYDSFSGKTVVVTGSGGYIGSLLVEALTRYDCKVVRVSRKHLPFKDNVQSIEEDIQKESLWSTIVGQADIIYHFAGNTSVYEANRSPGENLNSTVLPLEHLIKMAKNVSRVPRVVFASTATVYGLTSTVPVSESFEPKPVTVYDLHKLFAEQRLAMASRNKEIEAVSLRLANVYGLSKSVSSAKDRGILNRAAEMARRGENLVVYGDGSYVRDYVYIGDVVHACLLAGITPGLSGQSFNIGSGTGTTVKQAFELIATLAAQKNYKKIRVDCKPWPADAAPIEYRNYVADIRKFGDASGWRPDCSLLDGINRLLS